MPPLGRLKFADVLRLTGRCSNAAQNFMTISETIFSLELSGYLSGYIAVPPGPGYINGQATWSNVPSTLVDDSAPCAY